MRIFENVLDEETQQDAFITNEETFQTTPVVTIGVTHAIHDSYFAFLPALLPVLVANLSLTKTLAGLLSVFTQLPSLIQPFVGYAADRVSLRYVVILAPAVSGALLSLLGSSNNYAVLAFLLLAAGTSSAAFHSVGPVITGYVSGRNLGRGMSIWMMGGEFGRFLGPVIVVTAIGALTIKGLPWLMLGGIATTVVLYFLLKDVQDRPKISRQLTDQRVDLRIFVPIMLPIWAISAARALLATVFNTYLPLYLTERGSPLFVAGASLSLAAAAGVVGALISGSLSDRLNRKTVLGVTIVLSFISTVLFLLSSGWAYLPTLLLMGFSVLSTTPVVMAIVQEFHPAHRALANGIYMALSFITNAAAILAMGMMGDRLGLHTSFMIAAFAVLLGLPFVLMLPKDRKQAGTAVKS